MKESLKRHQYAVLLALVCVLHLVLLEAPSSLLGRAFWLGNVGLFLLWQPFVSGERRLGVGPALFVVAVVALASWQLGWGWLAAWVAFLSALVGGKVVVTRGRRLRFFYLLVFAYLLFVLFVWVAPKIVVAHATGAALPDTWVNMLALSLLAAAVASLPYGKSEAPAELFDFLASLLILLLLAVVLLGSTALMALEKIGYFDALMRTLFGLAGLLLLLSWAWNPRPGFGGIGVFLSSYLLRLGFPFDTWLRRLIELSDTESSPESFLREALATFAVLPWVNGGEWHFEDATGRFGESARHASTMAYGGVHVRLYTSYAWSAGLIWQASLLLKLVIELHRAKLREQALQQLRYLQAVHETGARLTHDVKNLLQSLDSLCYAAEQAGPGREEDLAQLFRRQLPVVSQRLRMTLDKLHHPEAREGARLAVGRWWEALRQRFERDGVEFAPLPDGLHGEVPQVLFDSVGDNLLLNALQKRRAAPGVQVRVELLPGGDGDGEAAGSGLLPRLRVTDSGAPVPAAVMARLFRAPVVSENGLGIGLFHAARLAEQNGFRLTVVDNRPGRVVFELAGAGAMLAV